MTYPSGFTMPGQFHADTVTMTSQPLLFRPPVASPSPSNSAFLDATPNRKRVRGGTPAAADDAPASISLFGKAALPLHTPVKAYALAGTLDTPGNADSGVMGESMYSDSDYRKALGTKRSRHDTEDDASSGVPTSLFHHDDPPRSPSQGWGSAAITVVGGVVGRVWEFCKAGAFKGFYAGGGRGFAMTETGAMVESDGTLPPADDYSYSYHYHYDDYEHRVPGHFPVSQPEYSFRATVDDVLPEPTAATVDDLNQNTDIHYRTASPTPSIPSAKRRQTTHGDDLGRNWVLVNEAAQQGRSIASATPRKISGGYRSSPRNRNHTPSVTTGRRISTTPTSNRASMSSAARFSFRPETPSDQNRRPASSASYASPRSASPIKANAASSFASGATAYQTTASTASTASPSHSPYSFSHSQTRGGAAGHRRRRSGNTNTTSTHRRANSTASAASSRGDTNEPSHVDSPRLDAEAKHLAARRKMEERDTDVRMSAFNKRLQDMIRQGKEALGTTIEVDDAGDEGCWVDED